MVGQVGNSKPTIDYWSKLEKNVHLMSLFMIFRSRYIYNYNIFLIFWNLRTLIYTAFFSFLFFAEFGVHLAELTVDPQGPMAIRQLASVLLRQYVEAHWCQHAEKFRLPETVENVSSAKYTDDNKVFALSLFL